MKTVEDEISPLLRGLVSPTTLRSLFNRLGGLATTPLHQLSPTDRRLILLELEASIRLFAPDESGRVVDRCARALEPPRSPEPLPSSAVRPAPPPPPLPAVAKPPGIAVRAPQDVSRARLESWSQAIEAGLSKSAALRVATAVTELARRTVERAARGRFEFRAASGELEVIAREEPPARKRRAAEAASAEPLGHPEGPTLNLVRTLAQEVRIDSRPRGGAVVVCLFREVDRPA